MSLSTTEGESGVLQRCFDETLFKNTITRERKRTERSGFAMVMLLIGFRGDGRGEDISAPFVLIGDAISAIKSDIDILGWFQQHSILGLIVPDIDRAKVASTCERLEAELRKEIRNRLHEGLAQRLSIRLHVYPHQWKLEEAKPPPLDSFLYPELHAKQQTVGTFHIVKRGMDILLSLLLLIILSPLLLAIAVLVKLSSHGPVIFRQTRVGHMMKPFMINKFRTMYRDSHHGIHHDYVSWFIKSSGKSRENGKKTLFKLTNDPRITPIGRLLRKSSFDELPQLWNVLVGDMSLVGPRPPLVYEFQQYEPWHCLRVLATKPGITGLWQVTGRSRTSFDEMVRLDLRYAKAMSLRTDIKILLATPRAVIGGKGAC